MNWNGQPELLSLQFVLMPFVVFSVISWIVWQRFAVHDPRNHTNEREKGHELSDSFNSVPIHFQQRTLTRVLPETHTGYEQRY